MAIGNVELLHKYHPPTLDKSGLQVQMCSLFRIIRTAIMISNTTSAKSLAKAV